MLGCYHILHFWKKIPIESCFWIKKYLKSQRWTIRSVSTHRPKTIIWSFFATFLPFGRWKVTLSAKIRWEFSKTPPFSLFGGVFVKFFWSLDYNNRALIRGELKGFWKRPKPDHDATNLLSLKKPNSLNSKKKITIIKRI